MARKKKSDENLEAVESNEQPKEAPIKEEYNPTPDEIAKMIYDATQKAVAEDRKLRASTDSADKKKYKDKFIKEYAEISTLTDKDFIRKLISWHVPAKLASHLRDSHAILSRQRLWEYLRENYREPKIK